MSRTWTRNPLRDAICGGPCRRPMQPGDPMLEIRIAEIKDPFKRCAACAGEPVPANLPPLSERAPIVPTSLARIRTGMEPLPFDFKLAQAGREPGEDDE